MVACRGRGDDSRVDECVPGGRRGVGARCRSIDAGRSCCIRLRIGACFRIGACRRPLVGGELRFLERGALVLSAREEPGNTGG